MPVGPVCVRIAAEGGHLKVLKWLRAEGCPWNDLACAAAAEGSRKKKKIARRPG